MAFLRRFWTWLTTATAGKPKKGHPDLYPIEIDKLAKELNLAFEAKRLGEAGLPAQDSQSLCGPESAIVQRVEKIRQDYVDWAVLRLNILSGDMQRRNVTQEVNRARQADHEFGRKAGGMMAQKYSLLRSLGDAARKQQSELDEFRKMNLLTRSARIPTSGESYFQYAVLLLFVVLEGAINASVFAKGLDTGLLGGFVEALLLAMINVAVAFLFGKFAIRYMNHVQPAVKAAGFFAFAFSLVVMVVVAFGIGHYRDSLTLQSSAPAKAALDALLNNTFHLADIWSWGLLVCTIVFGLLSLFDGLATSDLYPGYGAITLHTQSAIEDYEEEINILRGDLDALKDRELEELDETVKNSQASVAAYGGLIEDKKLAFARLSTALRDADHSLDALLRKFRTENELHRKGVKRPDYFNVMPSLTPIRLPDFSVEGDLAVLNDQRTQVAALLADVQNVRAGIQTAYNQHYNQVQPLDSHFSRSGEA